MCAGAISVFTNAIIASAAASAGALARRSQYYPVDRFAGRFVFGLCLLENIQYFYAVQNDFIFRQRNGRQLNRDE